ncbi:patatin-like phospholipase family protein [Bradyrhizobium sp.]|uniref:patatin-like phospholipase family protein n=1 Tax=Bradyrhizobium sp. TaxID=376 RepID=UPI002DDD07D1|nr:patatin-like phospholipase family protein [Bradyrhizobium sp.]HEV2159453.1 patatin-like phospholipase family protein [Bradyrhizobium sp.]
MPLNLPLNAGSIAPPPNIRADNDLAIGLAFSGGGTRAAAFAFGVLRGLERIRAGATATALDRVEFISGVSGGSITAAYYGLRGKQALGDFRERFLIRDAEADLRTDFSLGSLVEGINGGVNQAPRLSGWLDRNLFAEATMKELLKSSRPVIWINASDLYHRTPFVFSQTVFRELCSDLGQYPISLAVAASAAVPVAFSPIVLEAYPQSCAAEPPRWIGQVLANQNSGAQVKAFARALTDYRNPDIVQYLKLADGGLTDNYGLSGLVIARSAATEPYAPLTDREAVKLRNVVFILVNAGQGAKGEWSHTINGPSGAELLAAITDTAIDSSVRSGFDAFRLTIREWENAIRSWRCKLTSGEARKLGAREGWQCKDITFKITEVSFDQSDNSARLSSIPTRFKLPEADVDLLIRSGESIVAADPTLNSISAGEHR